MHEVTLVQKTQAGDMAAVVLRYVAGWASQAIGRRQGAAPGTVRLRLHRALEQLRNALERSGDR